MLISSFPNFYKYLIEVRLSAIGLPKLTNIFAILLSISYISIYTRFNEYNVNSWKIRFLQPLIPNANLWNVYRLSNARQSAFKHKLDTLSKVFTFTNGFDLSFFVCFAHHFWRFFRFENDRIFYHQLVLHIDIIDGILDDCFHI